MNKPIPPDAQELHAYVDGHLSFEERLRVEQRLGNDPLARKRADSYTTLNHALKQLYDPVVQEPIPAALQRKPRGWPRSFAAIAAGTVLLTMGVLMGTQLRSTTLIPSLAGEAPIVRAAAMAYAVYTPEVRHPVEVPADQEAHLVAWLTKRMGNPIRAPILDDMGFFLVGGRLVASDYGPSALLMYEGKDGKRIVLYVAHHEEHKNHTAFRFAQKQNVSVFYWIDGPLAYALAGEIDRAGLLGLANAVYGQLAI